MTNAEPHQPPDQQQVMHEVYRRGDRLMLGMLCLHQLFALWFAVFYDTWLEAWSVGGLAVGMFGVAMLLQPGAFLTRCVASVSLQVFVALHIYQLHGLAEMHFFFFTAFAAMIAYQDWRCMWPGALLIIAQHVLFAVMHNQGVDVYFYEGDYVGITKLGFHFGIALFHVVLCNAWAELLRRQTLHDHGIRNELALARHVSDRASTAKTAFLGNMSHELRTPMAGVLGMTELLLLEELSTQQRERLEVVRSSARAMVDIVNDALDLARVEAGKLRLTKHPFDLQTLAEEVVELLQPRAAENDVELVLRWQPGSPNSLLGDASRLRQILVNLTGNAIKFSKGSTVLLDIAVTPCAAGETAQVTLRVDDTGKGIAADVVPRLFQRYEQGGAATFGAFGGSGLGLAISRELTQLMGGELSLHSVLGAGTTLVLTLHLEVAHTAEPPPRHQGRALLVGRRELTMGVIAEQLEAMGLQVEVAADAAALSLRAQAAPLDLLLVEPELLDEIEAHAQHLRVVLLGNGREEAQRERIVWLSRSRALQNVIAGRATAKMSERAAVPQLGLRVLLVEDDAVCARVASSMLTALACQVTAAGDGEQGLRRFAEGTFDVILMDCRMPVLDGYEAIARIRAAETGRRTPIVALSANSLPQDRQRCLDVGADAFLTKPTTLSELTTTLRALGSAEVTGSCPRA